MRGVRRLDEIAKLGLSNRLIVRVGALLKKNATVSVALLELARPGSVLELLLLNPSILERGKELDTDTLKHLAEDQASLNMQLAVTAASDGVSVICLQEELDAGEGWAKEAPESDEINAAPVSSRMDAALTVSAVPLPLAVSVAPAANTEGMFSRVEIERWRLKLITASSASERQEALRTLILAPLLPAEKMDVLLQGLSDKDASVRAEAAAMLPGFGADPVVSEGLSGLNHAEHARHIPAAGQLLKILQHPLKDLEVGAIAVSAITMLRANTDSALTAPLLDLLSSCAAAIGRNPDRLAEVTRILTRLIAAAAKQGASSREVENALAPAHRLIKALGAAVPKTLLPVLLAEHERCAEPVSESFLLQSMLDLCVPESAEEENVVRLSVAYLARDKDEGRDSRGVGARLVKRGERALRGLCGAFNGASAGTQRYILILFDDICRAHKVSPEGLECAAAVVLQAIESGNKGLRMTAMECRFVTNAELSEKTRQALTKVFLDSIADFTFVFDIEKIESSLSRMGLAALIPLMERTAPEQPNEERVRAVRLLGELALNMKAPRGQIQRLQQGVTDVLRRLQALSLEADFPDRGELLCALGKLVSCPAASKEADAVVTRALLEAARGTDAKLVPRALEGLSYVASSRRAQADLIHATAELLRHVLDEAVQEIETGSKQVAGELVIEISGGEKYTTVLPIVLSGISRVACSSSCPPSIMRDLGHVLITRWKKILSGELMWGPTNTVLLVQALKELGCHKGLSPELRLEILRGFAPQHVQTPLMHALTEILAADDTPATAVGALTIGYAILGRRRKDGQFALEDRADILKAVARIVGRKVLGDDSPEGQSKAEAFRRRVLDELFKGMKDLIPYSSESLTSLRDKRSLPPKLQEEVERRMQEYEQRLAVNG